MKTAASRIRTIDLGYEQMMIFDDGRGERVRVLYGATWLTQEGDAEDAVLRPGTELRLSGGRTLIEALEPAQLQILGAARPPSAWRQLARRLQRGVKRLQFGPVQPEPVG